MNRNLVYRTFSIFAWRISLLWNEWLKISVFNSLRQKPLFNLSIKTQMVQSFNPLLSSAKEITLRVLVTLFKILRTCDHWYSFSIFIIFIIVIIVFIVKNYNSGIQRKTVIFQCWLPIGVQSCIISLWIFIFLKSCDKKFSVSNLLFWVSKMLYHHDFRNFLDLLKAIRRS